MHARKSRRLLAVTALAVIASFGAAIVAASAVHEDDGCVLELHCFACRWVMSSAAVTVCIPALPAAAIASWVAPQRPFSQHSDCDLGAPLSRAPPPPTT